MELAEDYEEHGQNKKALDLYRTLAAEAVDSSEFDRIYKNIVRLEGKKNENL
ncbi:MAG: hypothetical protein QGD88_07560 [Anaerolineae bacterium]|nr:hypothetical protein [Anaerolineae bacterium]MDK1081321.1 hypothetical protein [Anaerolineae bacterium]